MSVRMAPPLALIFLILIHGESANWGVNYRHSHICALKDSSVIMSCTYTYPTGYQIMKVFWTKNPVQGEKLRDLSKNPEYSQRLQYLGDKQKNCTIRLSHVTQKDEHMYYFRFTTNVTDGKWTGNPGVSLTVTDLQVEAPERVTEGHNVSLTCKSSCTLTQITILTKTSKVSIYSISKISSDHSGEYKCRSINKHGAKDSDAVTAEISWFKGGRFVGSGRIYSISKISSDHSGEYKCKSRNKHGETYSDTMTLNVMYPPRNVSVSINGSGEVEGNSVTLICSSDSNPPAEISWFKENQSSAVGSGQSFSALQSGHFYCEAHNQHGSQRSDAVTVTVKACGAAIFIITMLIVYDMCVWYYAMSVNE
uniref:Junctional adhesion molecule A-like n=1 Tax=Sinocyclocheilus rhinocerous TaxID=307959 RepID=A0A673FTZ3_9TELE